MNADSAITAENDGQLLNSSLKKSEIKIAGKYVGQYIEGVTKLNITPDDIAVLRGISTKIDLAEATALIYKRINEYHMLQGVTIMNPLQTYIDSTVSIGCDTVVYPNVIIEGDTVIGENCVIGANSRLHDMLVGDNVTIDNSVLANSSVEDFSTVGPFAYVRPGSKIGRHVKVGSFAEVKNSVIGDGTKIPHLSYVGDADLGENINFSCGSITVNYDGKNKHRITIEDNAFIGCNTNLIAPVTVHDSAYVAAGSTITDDVPRKALAIARARQVVKRDWTDKRS